MEKNASVMLPHLSSRIFGTPLMIASHKLDVILSVIGPRLNINVQEDDTPIVSALSADGQHGNKDYQVINANIAVIPIYGTLVHRTAGLDVMSGLLSYQKIKRQFMAAFNDTDIEHIVLDIDSPGGEVNGVFDLVDAIYTAREAAVKPITAIINESSYSAAYLLASAASEIIVPRTGGVGSIGVIAKHIDQSAKNKSDGYEITTVFAGARKNDFSPDEPLSDEAQMILLEEVNRTYDLFVETVARNRNLEQQDVRATDAGIFIGKSAIKAGLADKIMSADDAIGSILQSTKKQEVFFMAKNEIVEQPETDRVDEIAEAGDANTNLEGEDKTISEPSALEPQVAAIADQEAKDDTATVVSFADSASIAQAALDGGCPEMTPALLRDGVSLEEAKKRIDASGQIKQLCELAGMSDMSAGFIKAGLSTESVRAKLFDAMVAADESTRISSEIQTSGHAVDSQAPLDVKCKFEWDRSADLRAEFGDSFDAYLAYRKNESNVSILRNKR